MFQSHSHRAQKLVEIIDGCLDAFLRVEGGKGRVARVKSRRRLHRQPIDTVAPHLRLGQPVADGLKTAQCAVRIVRAGSHARTRFVVLPRAAPPPLRQAQRASG